MIVIYRRSANVKRKAVAAAAVWIPLAEVTWNDTRIQMLWPAS